MRKENSMNIIRLSSSIKKERQELNNIFEAFGFESYKSIINTIIEDEHIDE